MRSTALGSILALTACTTLAGVDEDYVLRDDATGGASSGATGGTAGSGASGGSGGAPGILIAHDVEAACAGRASVQAYIGSPDTFVKA